MKTLVHFFIFITVFNILSVNTWAGSVKQGHSRWRNDDGDEAAATWRKDEDVNETVTAISGNIRIRMELYNDYTNAISNDYSLYYKTRNCGYTQLTATSVPWHLSSSPHFTDGSATTEQLTNSVSSPVSGLIFESSPQFNFNLQPAASTELEFCIAPASDIFGGDYEFLLVTAAGGELTGSIPHPKLTINSNRWWELGSPGFSADEAQYTSIAVDGSGTPYIVYCDGSYPNKANVKKYNSVSGSWEDVGSPGISAGEAFYTSIAIDGSGIPYIAYRDGANSNLAAVKKFNSGSNVWEDVGTPGVSSYQADYTSLVIDRNGTPYLGYRTIADQFDYRATVKKYNSVSRDWEIVGTHSFSAGKAEYTSIAIDRSGIPYIVYQDWVNSNKATVMKYNPGSNTWENVGTPGFSAGAASYTSIAIDGSGIPYVNYIEEDDNYQSNTIVKKYNSGSNSWDDVGSPVEKVNYSSMALDNYGNPLIAFTDITNSSSATVKKYEPGSNEWKLVGLPGFSAGQADNFSIAVTPNGTPIVVYRDGGNSAKATVMKFSESQSEPLPVELSSFQASSENGNVVLKWQTATEVNNYGFEVERRKRSEEGGRRSEDGGKKSEVRDGWQKIGFVPGAGNSNSPKEYAFTDDISNVSNVSNFLYRLKQIDNDGTSTYSKEVEVNVSSRPASYHLSCYPNPFNPETTIEFSIPSKEFVTLKVYDLLGKEVANLVNEEKSAGIFNVNFNGTNLSSGIYIYTLKAGKFTTSKKLLLMK